MTLELALQYLKSNVSAKNRVKFAWWGGEELGLLGSTFYVNSLNKTKKLEDVAVYLNYGNLLLDWSYIIDMVGSINYVTVPFDGNTASSEHIRNVSIAVTKMYEKVTLLSSFPNISVFQ